MKNAIAKIVSAWIVLAFSVLAYAAEPVAMVTDLKGSAHLAGQGKPAALAVLTYLPPGEEIVLDAGSQVVVTYFDQSSEFSFKGPAVISIQQNSAKVIKGKPADVRNLDKEKSAGAAKFARSGKLVFAAVEMRALVFKPTLLSPVNTKISTLTPLFKWKSVNDPVSYHLLISDDAGRTVQDINVDASSWQLPKDMPLKPGDNYQWTVTETLKEGEKLSAKGSFSVADVQTSDRVFSKRPGADASFSEKVTYAIYLESEGFREDAKAIWRELAAERPDDPNLKFRAR